MGFYLKIIGRTCEPNLMIGSTNSKKLLKDCQLPFEVGYKI
jgi:hypothetical protein